tara:strand:- start:445 stop:993 length:549 start_codon:yes stop_codon:yes gene_type:complete
MTLQLSGQITAGNIGRELGKTYSSYMSMWNARNGRYGSINSQSERNPLNGISKTNSGYAFSDWYGYMHNARQGQLRLKQRELYADADTRVWRFRYDGQDLGQSWQWGTTSLNPWFYMPVGQRATVLFDNGISWGNSWQTADRRIYSNQRGYLLNVREPARTFRYYQSVYIQSSEIVSITNMS